LTPDPNPNGNGRYKGPRSPQARDREHKKKGRLPDRSKFDAEFDEGRNRWVGTLAVPVGGGQVRVFHGDASGVFWLMAALDDQYRQWLAAQSGKGGAR
jgi:hypothetical protein